MDEDSHEIRSRTDSYPAIADSSSVNANLDPHPDAIGSWGFLAPFGPKTGSAPVLHAPSNNNDDVHISLFCEAIDKRFVYNLLSRNCQDFAFVSALGLIKKEDRSLVWSAVFGSGEHRACILAMKTESRMVYAQIL